MATYGTFVDGVTLTAAEANDFLPWTAYTATLRQGTVTSSSSSAYAIVNNFVYVYASISVVNNGTANTLILVDMPTTAATNSVRVIGSGYYSKANTPSSPTNDFFRLAVVQYSTTRFAFLTETTTSLTTYWGQTNGPGTQLLNLDGISFFACYENS